MFIRSKDLQKRLGISKTTIWRWEREGRIPKPTRLSKAVVGWPEQTIADWLASKDPNQLDNSERRP